MDVDWGELYRTALPDLVRFLHRKVWDMERARDLAQDTFVRALRENPVDPRAWLFTVAANLARDEARTAIRRKRHLTLLKTEAEVGGVTVDPAWELKRGEREAAVRHQRTISGEDQCYVCPVTLGDASLVLQDSCSLFVSSFPHSSPLLYSEINSDKSQT